MWFFNLLMVILIGLPFMAQAASPPIPTKKPTSSFNAVLEKASEPVAQTVKSAIITPPPLPEQRRKAAAPKPEITFANNMPYPKPKPFKVMAKPQSQPTAQKPRPPQDVATIDLYSDAFNDGRTAGRGSRNIERSHATRRPSVRETTEKSPFKTAQLPRAQKSSRGEPVIIFFKENSSELEVGQIDIIKSDIITALKRSPSRKVAIYGYAQRQTDSEKTNQLSLSRALLISEYIADQRISPERIEARSMGDDTPIRPKNRVDVVIF